MPATDHDDVERLAHDAARLTVAARSVSAARTRGRDAIVAGGAADRGRAARAGVRSRARRCAPRCRRRSPRIPTTCGSGSSRRARAASRRTRAARVSPWSTSSSAPAPCASATTRLGVGTAQRPARMHARESRRSMSSRASVSARAGEDHDERAAASEHAGRIGEHRARITHDVQHARGDDRVARGRRDRRAARIADRRRATPMRARGDCDHLRRQVEAEHACSRAR